MFVIEIYSCCTFMLLVATYGLPQTCFGYCKQSTQEYKHLRPECNCTIYNQSHLSSDLSVSHESHEHPFHFSAENFETQISDFTNKEGIIPSRKELGRLDINNEKYNHGKKHKVGYPLYIDLRAFSNKPDTGTNPKEELKHILDKVRASEAHLSECTDLHIYIFSKNNDNINKPDTNWGQHVKHDNLMGPEVLTEILNECDHPTTIVRETVFEIKKRQDVTSTNNYSMHDDKYKTIQNDFTLTSQNRGLNIYGVGNELENKYTRKMLSSINKNIIVDKVGSTDSSAEEDVSRQDQTTHLNKTKHLSGQIRKPPKGFRRSEYLEKDIVIPKILTKEHANNTISSVVDGFETLPNLDFISNDDLKTDNVLSSIEDNSSNLVKSSPLKDVKGNLHVSLENKLIPARFIVNSEGATYLAVDGFSLCDRLTPKLQEKHMFMKLFCECIRLKKCLP